MHEVVGATWQFYAYVVFAVLLAGWISRKTDKKFFSFVILSWLFAGPVAERVLTGKLGFLPFDINPDRLLLLFSGVMLSMHYLGGARRNRVRAPGFEKYMFIYILLVLLAVLINRNYLPAKWLIAIPLEPLVFVALYFTIKVHTTRPMLEVLLKGVVVFAVINSVVAIVQLFVDPGFIRIEEARRAFGSYYRSFGVFRSEYIFGAYQATAVFVALVAYRKEGALKIFLPLIILSIFTTFHRMDMIGIVLSLIVYMAFYASRKRGVVPILVILFAVSVLLPLYSIIKSSGGGSQLVEERLMSDTVSGRIKQYGVVIKALPKYPLGLGSYSNSKYQDLMVRNGIFKSVVDDYGRQTKEALGVHDGFLGVAIQYGLLAMLVFIMMIYKAYKYFHNLYKETEERFYVVPIMALLIWVLVNASNGVILFRDHNVLVVSMLMGLMAGAASNKLLAADREKPGLSAS